MILSEKGLTVTQFMDIWFDLRAQLGCFKCNTDMTMNDGDENAKMRCGTDVQETGIFRRDEPLDLPQPTVSYSNLKI